MKNIRVVRRILDYLKQEFVKEDMVFRIDSLYRGITELLLKYMEIEHEDIDII